MVRTKAGSVSNKAIGAKAPQKVTITAILSGNAPKTKHTGGNPYHPRETPGWQKPITFFMKQDGESSKDESIEIEDLPGLPGIPGDVISPKASGTKRKSKGKKSTEPAEADDEKKVKSKKSRKKSPVTDLEEKGRKNKRKEASDMDVERKSKKKKKEEAGNSEKEDDAGSEDANGALEDKENIENFKTELDIDEESPAKKKSNSNGQKNLETVEKDEGNGKVQKSEENEIQTENGDEDADIQGNGETDEEMEEKNNNCVMDQDEFEAGEEFEDGASENA